MAAERQGAPFGDDGAWHGARFRRREEGSLATLVLVHGAMHGGWCWKRVVPLLRAADHDVYAPTLTGLGERAHLAHPGIDLATHVWDVLGVLEYEDLDGVEYIEAEDIIVCRGECGYRYPVRDDIPVLLVDEARKPD